MLCQITPGVGNHADNGRARYYNFWCSVHAIATAAAGATPVVNPVNSSGTRNTSHNCITVLGNSEAGGWLAGTSNHYTASSTYNNNAGVQYLDLYKESGKSTYPWLRMVFGPHDYPFNSNFDSYPGVRWWAGATSSNPTSVAFTSTEAAFYTNPNSGTYSSSTAIGENATTTNTEHRLRVEENRTYTVAITSNYFIIASQDYLWYFGLRTVGGWELNRTDNPPWVHFSYTRRENGNGITYSNDSNHYNHTDRVIAFGATINQGGTQYAPTMFGQQTLISTGTCVLTGMNGFARRFPTTSPIVTSRYVKQPIFQSDLNSNWGPYSNNGGYTWLSDGVVADTVTGLSVPPVYPIVFNLINWDHMAYAMGTAPGIYKGMHGSSTMTDYFVTGASYTIGGDTYVPVRSGNSSYKDLWFLRSA